MKKDLRKAVIAGNWKMNNTPAQTTALINEMKPLVAGADCDVVLCVPYVDIAAAVEAAKGSNIKIGAENVHFKASGAYTGEVSADMLVASGVEYVVIGHSERRQYFGETDQTVNLRSLAALNAGLKAIICVGETLEQRELGYTETLLKYQTKMALTNVTKEQLKNTSLLRQTIHDGDIIAIITNIAGLDTQHIGIAVWHDDGLHLLNASSIHHKVVEEPMTLQQYLFQHKTMPGIRIIRS